MKGIKKTRAVRATRAWGWQKKDSGEIVMGASHTRELATMLCLSNEIVIPVEIRECRRGK